MIGSVQPVVELQYNLKVGHERRMNGSHYTVTIHTTVLKSYFF
jgi:hypothetical protein